MVFSPKSLSHMLENKLLNAPLGYPVNAKRENAKCNPIFKTSSERQVTKSGDQTRLF